jgi:hypothetical protein
MVVFFSKYRSDHEPCQAMESRHLCCRFQEAYWAACTLHAGVKLDLLSAILTEWRSSQQSWG